MEWSLLSARLISIVPQEKLDCAKNCHGYAYARSVVRYSATKPGDILWVKLGYTIQPHQMAS